MTMPLGLVWDLIAVDKASPTFARVGAAAGAAAASTERAMTRFNSATKTMAVTGSTLSRKLTLPLAAVGVASVKMAVDYQSSMQKIASLTGVSQKQVDSWSKSILSLSGKVAKSPKELADAMYYISSSGIPASKALETLTVSAKASAAGLGDTKVVADAVTSAMNAYGPATMSAKKATDILIATIREGKGEPEELAGTLGRILPYASQLGVSFDQVGASMASMTRVGLDAFQAATGLRAIFSGLTKVMPQTDEQLAKVGLSAAGLRDELKTKGLNATLQTLQEKFHGNVSAMAHVFPNIRALSGYFAQMGKQTDATAAIFERMSNTTGTLDKAFDTASQTAGFKLKKALADLQVTAIHLGDTLLPVVTAVVQGVGKLAKAFDALPSGVKKSVVGIGLAAALLGPILVVVSKLGRGFVTLWKVATIPGRVIANLAAGRAAFTGVGLSAAASSRTVIAAETAQTRAVVAQVDAQMVALARLRTQMAAPLIPMGAGAASRIGGGRFSGVGAGAGFAAGAGLLFAGQSTGGKTGSVLTGAGTGALIGSTFGPIGAAAGAAGGGLIGAFGSKNDMNDLIRRVQALKSAVGTLPPAMQKVVTASPEYKAALASGDFKAVAAIIDRAGHSIHNTATEVKILAHGASAAVGDIISLTDAINGLDHGALGAASANVSFKLALKDLPGQLAKNNKGIEGNSKAALSNRQALLGLIGQVKAHASAMQEAGRKAPAVARAINTDVAALKDVATNAGVSTGEFQRLIRQMHLTPKEVRTRIIADTGGAETALQRVGGMIQYLQGTHVVDLIVQTATGVVHARASGGGLPKGWAAVGERGPELAYNTGSGVHIYSHEQSKAIIAATGMRAPGFAGGTDPKATSSMTEIRALVKALHGFRKALSGTSNDVRSAFSGIRAAFKDLGASHTQLQKLAREDNKLAHLIHIRNRDMAKLANLRTARDTLSTNVRGAVKGSFDIASSGTGFDNAQKPTFGNIMAQAVQDRNIVRKWLAGLKKIAKVFGKSAAGKAMLRRLFESGPDSLPQVEALAAARPGQLRQLVGVEAQISALGARAGAFAGSEIYGDRIAAARRAVREDRARDRRQLELLRHDIHRLADALHVTLKVDGKVLATTVLRAERQLARRS